MTQTNSKPRPLRFEICLAIALFTLVVSSRWLIDIPNFKPVMAIALFSGFLFSRRWLGASLVFAGMALSDALIGFYDWRVAVAVYAALILPMFCGVLMRMWKNNSLKLASGVIGFAGLSALFFYATTTIAVWACMKWYPADLGGLLTAFAMGLPFLKWTLLGNILFSSTLFGAYGLARTLADSRNPAAEYTSA